MTKTLFGQSRASELWCCLFVIFGYDDTQVAGQKKPPWLQSNRFFQKIPAFFNAWHKRESKKMEKRAGIVNNVIAGSNRLDIPSKKLYTGPMKPSFTNEIKGFTPPAHRG